MSDAPFGRSDSEDDIVEDYDEPVVFKTSCLRERTSLEKCLLLAVIVCVAVIIGLSVGLTRPSIVPVTKYCKSPACVQAAGSLLSALDWSVDPCTDFYKFACGQWVQTHPIPTGYNHWDRFQELSGQNLYVLSNLIESASHESLSINKTRDFYNSCMKSVHQPREDLLQQFSRLIDAIGGWSLSPNDTSADWSLFMGLENVHRLGAWPFFKLTVEEDERDPTKAYIIKIDVGDTVLQSDLLPFLHMSQEDIDNDNSSHSQALKDAHEVRSIYLSETAHILRSLGASSAEADKKAQELFQLESRITAATQGFHHIHDRFSLYNVMTVGSLDDNYTIVSWIQYLNVLGFRVVPDTEVVVLHPDYMTNITEILIEYYRGSPDKKSILRDYLAMSVVRSFKSYFDTSLFEIEETEDQEMKETWKRCTFYTNSAFGYTTGAMYVKGSSSEGSIEKMEKLITYVKNAFRDYLLNKYWMDKLTRKRAEEKVDAIIDKISYPSKILNNTFLDMHYKSMIINKDDWLSNLLSWRRFNLGNMNTDLFSVPDRKTSWLRPPVTVNAIYSPTKNDVIFPIAMFHLPFYIPDGPSAVNFGAMGSIIGHEITHAFDFQGRQYDGLGKLSDWWEQQTASNFLTTTKCMKDQYSNIRVRGVNIDGDFTLDENIADNGGLRAAMYAYQMWIDQFGDELQLPGVNMSMYQVFYTSFAQMYCSKWSDAGLFLHLITDPHSPGSARVNGVLSNSQTFNWAFNCPMDTPMNPRVKCQVW